jgi:PAS domain S-box-containing protein
MATEKREIRRQPRRSGADRLGGEVWAWYLLPASLVVALAAGLPREGAWEAAPIAVISAVLFIVALVRLRGVAIDVEVYRRLVGELADARARYRDLVERVPAIVFTDRIGPGGTSVAWEYVSPQAKEILGVEPEEILADPHVWDAIVHPEDRERVATGYHDWVQAILSDPSIASPTRSDEYRVVTRDERVLWFREVARAVAGDDGLHHYVQGVLVDITERRRAEEAIGSLNEELEARVADRTRELEEAKAEAVRADRAKGEFLSAMSHDLRTPLNAILGFGQLLELSTLGEPDRDSVEQILRAGRQLLAMIDDILEFTRVDSGRLTLAIEPIVVAEAVREAMDLVRTQAVERGVQLEWPSGADPGLAVLADRRRLVQVLLNLLVNAVKFSREGGTVTVAAEPLGEERARIIVRDTGIGISPERIPRIFEPFEADPGGRSGSRSIGLGLAVGSRLVRAMGGSISVESQIGTGSAFSLDLPRADSPITVGSYPGSPETGADRSVPTILYIEDNLPNITLVQRLLGRHGDVRMLAAMQGRLGLELAREYLPDLILLDLRLPDVTPEEMLRELKADTRTRDIPVVMLSSEETPSRMGEMRALGASDYLTKPIDVAAFLATVDAIFGTS